MADVRSLLRWAVEHWKAWSIPTAVGTIAGIIGWGWSRARELRAYRQAKADKDVDAQVLEALGNSALWPMPRPVTGAGVPAVRASEVAEHLSLGTDAVYESLERLEMRGRVRKSSGTMDNPAPYWHLLLR